MSAALDVAKQSVKQVTRATIIDVIRIVIEAVEKDETLKGKAARDAAIEIIEILILDVAKDDQEWLADFANSGMIETIIDTVIAASKGLYALNQKKSIKGCMLACIGKGNA